MVASTVFVDLVGYGRDINFWDGDSPLPTTDYGACKVADDAVVAPSGIVLAHLGCGITVVNPGLVDPSGIQVGSRGDDVIERYSNAAQRISCIDRGDHARCWFAAVDTRGEVDEYAEPIATYTVRHASARSAVAPDEIVSSRGSSALAILSKGIVHEIHLTMYCH